MGTARERSLRRRSSWPAPLASAASRPPRNGAFLTVAIDGRGGAGKSSLADWLAVRVPGLRVVHGDDWFRPHGDAVTWGEYDDAAMEVDVLARLRDGTWDTASVAVVVERCFAFSLDVPWDVRIWVETPAEVCLARGLVRDAPAVGDERAHRAWLEVWQPREDAYITASRPHERADLVVRGDAEFDEQLG